MPPTPWPRATACATRRPWTSSPVKVRERVREFAAAGVHFDRDAHGHMLRGLEAAHSRARSGACRGDATGKVFELDVSAMVRKNPRITSSRTPSSKISSCGAATSPASTC